MPTIGQAVREFEERNFVDRERELEAFRTWLLAEPSVPEILGVSGPGGVGKSALLEAFRRTASELGRDALMVDAADFRSAPDAFLRALGGATLEEVVASLGRSLPLVLIDSFEDGGDLARYVLEELVPELDSRVKVVLAGRYPFGEVWGRGAYRGVIMRPMLLEGLSPEQSQTYLQGRGLDEPDLLRQIVSAVKGHPLALSLAADLVLQLGIRNFTAAPEWHLVLRSLVESLLREIEDPALKELLEACAVVRQFDEATLGAVAGKERIGAAFDSLCRLSIVRAAERGLMLHVDVRGFLTDDLRWRDLDRYKELQLRASAYYRERAGTASLEERGRLMAERFFLWEDAFIQGTMFGRDQSGEVRVDWYRPEDREAIVDLWIGYSAHGSPVNVPPPAEEFSTAILEALLEYAGSRVTTARARDGRVLAFGIMLPLCRDSIGLLPPAGARLVQTYWTPQELAALPKTSDDSNIFYFFPIVMGDGQPEAAAGALLREGTGIFARGGVYLAATANPLFRAMMEACGFERLPEAGAPSRNSEEAIDGYVLDLASIGIDAWLDAMMAGRRPPRALRPGELERELQTALLNWRDDDLLAGSPLASILAPEADGSTADVLRRRVLEAFRSARETASQEEELAYRATELAYLDKTLSHERAAERLAVSRSTFYRLLKRGVHGLAGALAQR